MKKILLILLAVIISLPSCTKSVPVVKKDRVYIYDGEDKFGEIVPDLDDPEILVREYNESGIVLKETKYSKRGDVRSITEYEVNGENVIIREKMSYGKLIIFEKDKNGHWIRTIDGDGEDFNLLYEHFDIKVSFLTDEIGKNLADAFTTINGNDCDVKFSYKHTKFNENGNWIEGECTEEDSNGHSDSKIFYKREILEVWE